MEKLSQTILESPLITFVIVNYNGGKYLNRCLSSIKEQDLDHECIVIDNNSSDNSKEILKESNVKNIFLRKNEGYSKAINIGLKLSKGRYIYLMTPTTFLKENSVKNMLKHINSEKVGITAPKLMDEKNNVIKSIRNIPTPLSLLIGQFGLSELNLGFLKIKSWKLRNFDYSKHSEVEQPMSCALLLKREVFKEIGLLDERFFLYFSDVDFSKRVLEKYKILYTPDSEAIHIRGGLTKILKEKRIVILNNDLLSYLDKYHSFAFYLFFGIIFLAGKIRYLLEKKHNKLSG
jgi:N-acetylglucosaminyl-diphospho-decaprenol L-rhamnosyltransferase